MMVFGKFLFFTAWLLSLALLGAPRPSHAAGNPSVDCDKGQSLQQAINTAKIGATINVRGTCTGVVIVATPNLTLDGGGAWVGDVLVGGATVNAGGQNNSAIRVVADFVTIRGFTITGSLRNGISVSRAGSANIFANMIEGNARHGVSVNQSAYARIGENGFGHLPDEGNGNIIRGNGFRGVSVSGSADAAVRHNKILDNGREGIRVHTGASAGADGNLIDGNARDGIAVDWLSAVTLSTSPDHPGENNTISNNGHWGVECDNNSIVRGDDPIYGTLGDANGFGTLSVSSGCRTQLTP